MHDSHPLHQPSGFHRCNPLLFALLSLFITFSACKDNDDDPDNNTIPKIKTMAFYVESKLSLLSTYTYDTEGRILSENREGDSFEVLIQYAWLPGKVIVKYDAPDWEENIQNDTLLLNEKGLQVSESSLYPVEYDAQGYLIKRTVFYNKVPYLHTFQIENGNTVRWNISTGKDFEIISTEYVNEFLPNSVNTIGNENMGISFYGKQDKNLMAKSTYISHEASGINPITVHHIYESDARGRVAKQSTLEDPGFYTLFTYYE